MDSNQKKWTLSDPNVSDYISVMEKTLACVRELRVTEEKMVRAAAKDDTAGLDGLVKEAQPALLQFRGQDRQRNRLESCLGFSGKKPDEILSCFAEDARQKLEPVMQELVTELRRFSETRENADRIMKVKLDYVTSFLREVPEPEQFHDLHA